MLTFEQFTEMKSKEETEYKKIGKVFCPYLKKEINFNRKGLEHLKTKKWNKTREVVDQVMRIKLLKYAPGILASSHTLQEYDEKTRFERQNINSKWVHRQMLVKFYGFVAIIQKNVRIKIIIKEVQGGEPYFLSIIPFWKQKKHPISNQIERVLCEGDLEKQ